MVATAFVALWSNLIFKKPQLRHCFSVCNKMNSRSTKKDGELVLKMCIFGSASSETPKSYLDASFQLGKLVATKGHICINGGGKNGCMGALNEGCKEQGGEIVCVIHEMFVVDGQKFQGADKVIIARGTDLAERKRLLNQEADCIIALPGGAGTFDELWESVCAVGLGFMSVPIICVNVDGYYDSFQAMLHRAQKERLIKADRDVLHFANDAASALDLAERLVKQAIEAGTLRPSMPSCSGSSVNHLWGIINNSSRSAVNIFVLGVVFGATACLMAQRLARAR